MNPVTCTQHGEALTRIEATLESIDKRFERLNGSVARHEGEIVKINLTLAREEGRRGGAGMVIMWAVTMIGLVFAGWQGFSAHQQTAAALAQIHATQQQQAQR